LLRLARFPVRGDSANRRRPDLSATIAAPTQASGEQRGVAPTRPDPKVSGTNGVDQVIL
jgi:hypothetical protein